MITFLVNVILAVAAGVALVVAGAGAWLACAMLIVVGREVIKALTTSRACPEPHNGREIQAQHQEVADDHGNP